MAKEIAEASEWLPPANRPLMVSVLLPEAPLPSVAYSRGLYVAKRDYGKLLVPIKVAEDSPALTRAIGRGWAYHVGASRTEDTIEAWLLEAMSALVDADLSADMPAGAFSARELNSILEGASKSDSEEDWMKARIQCGNIGRRVVAKLGKLEEVLDAHLASGWSDLLQQGKASPTDKALRRVWSSSVADLIG